MVAACLFLAATPAWAETSRPYAGMEERAIKALSQEEVADLKAGRGMGMALTAELNGYPGPLHVLELAEELELSPEQEQQVRALHAEMQTKAAARGEDLLALEAELDRAFAEEEITPERLESLTAEIGQAQARLRATHLTYHLTTRDLLNARQLAAYGELRGYDSEDTQGSGGHHHGGSQGH